MKTASTFAAVFLLLAALMSFERNVVQGAPGPSVKPPPSLTGAWRSPVTHFTVSGMFLDWFKNYCDLDYLGQPISELTWDATTGLLTQRFQRGTLELRDGGPQPRMVVDELWPDNDAPVAREAADNADYQYDAVESGGLGHAVRNYVLHNGQTINIGFKQFFDRCGGEKVLGYPKEESQPRGKRWTQRFQGAMLIYHDENDTGAIHISGMPVRNWKVLAALPDEIRAYAARASEPPPGMMNVHLVFVSRDGAQLVPQTRHVPATRAVITATVRELLRGPQDDNLRAAIAPDTALIRVDFDHSIAQPNFSWQFLKSENHQLAVQSVTQTLTQIHNVNGVRFRVDGKPLAHYWGADFAQVFTR